MRLQCRLNRNPLCNLNNKIPVNPAFVDQVRALYAPPDHPVFQLVPPDFAALAAQFYETMGFPVITRATVWDIYDGLLDRFQSWDPEDFDVPNSVAYWDQFDIPDIDLIENLVPLANASASEGSEEGPSIPGYIGGVNNGAGLGPYFNLCCVVSGLALLI